MRMDVSWRTDDWLLHARRSLRPPAQSCRCLIPKIKLIYVDFSLQLSRYNPWLNGQGRATERAQTKTPRPSTRGCNSPSSALGAWWCPHPLSETLCWHVSNSFVSHSIVRARAPTFLVYQSGLRMSILLNRYFQKIMSFFRAIWHHCAVRK